MCDSTIISNISVSSNIIVNISQLGNNITSTVSGGTAPYVFSWNTGEITDLISPTTNGVYWLLVKDANGCISDTSFISVDWLPTSINNYILENLKIYPNPSRNIFNISFNTNNIQNIQIRIINILGEIIIKEDLEMFEGEYNRSVNLNKNVKGIYFLEIETNKGIINKKLILQ